MNKDGTLLDGHRLVWHGNPTKIAPSYTTAVTVKDREVYYWIRSLTWGWEEQGAHSGIAVQALQDIAPGLPSIEVRP